MSITDQTDSINYGIKSSKTRTSHSQRATKSLMGRWEKPGGNAIHFPSQWHFALNWTSQQIALLFLSQELWILRKRQSQPYWDFKSTTWYAEIPPIFYPGFIRNDLFYVHSINAATKWNPEILTRFAFQRSEFENDVLCLRRDTWSCWRCGKFGVMNLARHDAITIA